MVQVTRKSGPGLATLKAMGELDDLQARIGWFQASKYPDKDSTPVAYVAAIQEFGYQPRNIPPRLGFRGMCKSKAAEWRSLCNSLAKAVLKGASATSMLTALAGKVRGDGDKQIASVVSPALAEATVKARARRYADGKATKSLKKPLEDTGYMRETLTFVVGKSSDFDGKEE